MKHYTGTILAAMLFFMGVVFLWKRRPKPQ